MKLVIIFLCTIVYMASLVCDVSVLGVSSTSDWYTHLTYIFVHRSFIHYILNIIGLWFVCRASESFHGSSASLIIITSAVLSSIGTIGSDTIVGCSGCVYAGLGIVAAYYHSKEYIESLIIAAVCNATLVIIGANIAWQIHLLSFIYALTLTLILKWNKHLISRLMK